MIHTIKTVNGWFVLDTAVRGQVGWNYNTALKRPMKLESNYDRFSAEAKFCCQILAHLPLGRFKRYLEGVPELPEPPAPPKQVAAWKVACKKMWDNGEVDDKFDGPNLSTNYFFLKGFKAASKEGVFTADDLRALPQYIFTARHEMVSQAWKDCEDKPVGELDQEIKRIVGLPESFFVDKYIEELTRKKHLVEIMEGDEELGLYGEYEFQPELEFQHPSNGKWYSEIGLQVPVAKRIKVEVREGQSDMAQGKWVIKKERHEDFKD